MENLEKFVRELLDLNSNIDVGLIERAYRKAEQMHKGQFRKSGEPYLVHPVEVAKILAGLGMDECAIVAGLLHDAVEDTPYSMKELINDFGAEVALLVDGVTKLRSLVFESKEERQAENLRKMFFAMSKDIRVLIIKLADRLHNLRTINYMNEEQILEKCKETVDIYAPLASRLGIYAMKFEMEDIALKYIDPDAYHELVHQVRLKKQKRDDLINHVVGEVRGILDDLKLNYEVTGRSKHFYSIYRKMKYQNKQLDEIFDMTAVRIIVETVKDCYSVLGVVHTMWKPLPGRFKDYIAMPKPNRYQSIHTTVLGENGDPFEIQIRTRAMHRVAEYGIAAHWKYKEGVAESREEVRLSWLRQTLEWQKDMKDPQEFMETLKVDLFSNQVFVFTPKGDVIELPSGSTPLDFAFKIHTDVGAKCIGAKVNGKMVPIDYTLKNGQIIDIVTSSNSKPSIDWLQIAKSSNARSKIRQWMKRENRTENAEKGREMLEKSVRRKGYDPQDVVRSQWLNRAVKTLRFSTVEELYTSISYGGAILNKVSSAIIAYYEEDTRAGIRHAEKKEEKARNAAATRGNHKGDGAGVSINGVDHLLIRLARCCNPVPGDEIIGFITKGRGVSVHRKDCSNIPSISLEEKDRLIAVNWNKAEKNQVYDAEVTVLADERKGLFSDIARVCEDMDVHIAGVNAKSVRDGVTNIVLTLSISNTGQMERIRNVLRNVAGVMDVYRSMT